VAAWLVACIATGVFLVHSAHVARNQLRLASQNTVPGKVDFSGGMSSDLHALHTIRYAIHSLDNRPAWRRNWMPYQSQVNAAQTKLEAAYADAFYREVLTANLNPLLMNVISGPTSAAPNDVDIALAQNLVRRINLLEARLDDKNLSAMPSPGPELTALMPALQNGSVSLIDGLLFGDMYRDYLTWQSNTHLLNDERRALQKALINIGLSSRPIQWVDTWAALQPQLQPMRMTDFWDIGDATDMPEVPATMTLKGKQAVLAFMQEVAHASDETQAWEARQEQFRQLFLDNGLQDWYAFSDAFIHAPDLLRDATSRRTVLSALMTSTGPYRRYMQDLSRLAQSVPESRRPEWLNQSIRLTKLGSLVQLPETKDEKQKSTEASTLTTLQNLKVVQKFGGDVIKSLPKGNAIREGFSSLDSDQQDLSLMQDYLKGVRSTAQALQQGSGNAMATAIQIWSFGHDPKVKDVALVSASSALEKLRKAFGPSTDSRTTVVWQLAAGPLDFTLDYAARSAACTLQNNWEANVVGAVKGLTDKQLADTLLFGDRGQVNAFLAGDVQHFVTQDGTQYQAREALGDTVPFSGQFYAFASLAQLRKASVAGQQLAEQRTQQAGAALQAQAKQLDAQIAKLQEVKGNVTLSAEPPLTNSDAKVRPESITLTLQCASGPITLENLNFANSQVFPWSMSSCADTELVIRYPGFQLRQQWGGAAGFINFLKAYASGQRRYTSADFPSEADAMKQAGIKWLDVIFHQQGQADVLKAFAEADKLNTQASEVQAKLDAMQETAAQAPEAQGAAGPISLPSHIVTVCMGPANNIGRFTASSADAQATTPHTKGKTPKAPVHKAVPHSTRPKAVPVAPVSRSKAGAYAVQVGIFAHPEKVRDALDKAHYTLQDDAITLNGHQYRNIRAIGYDTRQAADDAAKQIAELLKLKPVVVHVAP
jgi:type VI secretion system protein ImpL